MKRRIFSLPSRLIIVFLLLSPLPLLVMYTFFHYQVLAILVDSERFHHLKMTRTLAQQLSLVHNPDETQKILMSANDLTYQAFVIDENGFYLVHQQASRRGQSMQTDFSESIVQQIVRGNEGWLEYKNVFLTFTTIPNTHQYVVLEVDRSDITQSLTQLDQNFFWQLAACLLIISLAGGWAIWLLVGSPLKKLIGAADRIGGGDLDVRVEPAKMQDELSVLAKTFNQMAERIRDQVNGLHNQVETLNQAQQALQQNEERTKNILDALNDAIFVQDAESGALLEVNRKAAEMYGYSREELLQIRMEDISANFPPYTGDEALRSSL